VSALIYSFTGSIGANAKNATEDVWMFQMIVNALPASVRGSAAPLTADGKMGPGTMQALVSIQKKAVRKPDGVLTPGGPTQKWIEAQLKVTKLPVLRILLPMPPDSPPAAQGVQSNWRWCNKCQGLFFAGNGGQGVCPKGGGHSAAGSGNYKLSLNSGAGQSGWRWCKKCQGLYFGGGGAGGKCPSGGAHDGGASGNYFVDQNKPAAQDNWRWCQVCAGMFFAGSGTAGACAGRSNGHDKSASGNYGLLQA